MSMILIALSVSLTVCFLSNFHYEPTGDHVIDGFRGTQTGLMKYTSALALHSIPFDISQKGYSHLSRGKAFAYRGRPSRSSLAVK